MFNFEELNKDYTSKFNFELGEKAEYVKPADLDLKETYVMRSIFINEKSKFGAHPVCAIEADNENKGLYVSLPAHLLETAKAILANDDAIKAINARQCGIKAKKFVSKKYNTEGYSIDFVNLNNEENKE